MEIGQPEEPGYVQVKIGNMGYMDEYAIQGIVVFRSDSGKEFHMNAFSGEVVKHMASFGEEDRIPSIYGMVEEICEACEMMLVKVKIYESGGAMRANLYLTGRRDLVLRNYRASDAVALASLYKVPIMVREELLKEVEAGLSGGV